ncbi:MAG: hypothetical protein QW193_05020 [Nitrososphaerales archaeon]
MIIMQKQLEKTIALTFVFLMLLTAISTPCAIATEAQIPSLSIGNRWKYRVEYYDPDTGTVTMNGTTVREIIGESNITIDSTTYNCFVEKIEGEWKDQSVIWTMNGTVYRVKSDLSIVKEDMEIMLKVGGEIALHQISNVTYNPPLMELNFTLTEGKEWSVSVMKTETVKYPNYPEEPPDTRTVHIARNYTIGETMEKVKVDERTFDAFVITYKTSDTIYEQYYSSAVSNIVMELVKRRLDERLMIKMILIESNVIPPSAPIEWWVWLVIVAGVVACIVVIFLIRMRKPSVVTEIPKIISAKNSSLFFFKII